MLLDQSVSFAVFPVCYGIGGALGVDLQTRTNTHQSGVCQYLLSGRRLVQSYKNTSICYLKKGISIDYVICER